MRITCLQDECSSMGYIYLMPPVHESALADSGLNNDILTAVPADRLRIEHVTEPAAELAERLDRMTAAKLSYFDDFGIGYDTEYGNDVDENGYVTGIELSLTPERLIEQINGGAFRVISLNWKKRAFNLLTLDFSHNVFDERNVLYRMNDQDDVFAIVALPERTFLDESGQEQTLQIPIAEIRGLLSAREDLYPLDFWLKPDFLLVRDAPTYDMNDLSF